MSAKSENTKLLLISALERIDRGQAKLVSNNRKLSIRAVEEEANLGDGTAYYYPEVVNLVRKAINKSKSERYSNSENKPDVLKLKEKLKDEQRIKEKYYQKILELKALLGKISAAQNACMLENKQLREQLSIIQRKAKLPDAF